MRPRQRTTEIEHLAYSVSEAAEAAGLGKTIINRAVASGELPTVQKYTRRLILAEDLLEWLRRDRVIGRNGKAIKPPPQTVVPITPGTPLRVRGRPPKVKPTRMIV